MGKADFLAFYVAACLQIASAKILQLGVTNLPTQNVNEQRPSQALSNFVHVYKCVSHAWEQLLVSLSMAAQIISHC